MKLSITSSVSFLAVTALSSHQVSAHGYLVQPLAKFISVNIDKTQYSSTIDSYKLFPEGTFNTDPKINVASFVDNYKSSAYKSVKAMIEDNQALVSNDATASCGFSDPSQTSYGALNNTVYWGRNDDITMDEGLVHPGPCEVWCDDNQIQQNMECQAAYTPALGKGAAPVPIDSSVCKNAKRLTFYWVAMHGATWQVYINCVNINGGSSGIKDDSSSTMTSTGPATTSPMQTSAPSTPNYDDETTSSAEYDESTTPLATTATPVSTPAVEDDSVGGEASTTSKCLKRRRIRD